MQLPQYGPQRGGPMGQALNLSALNSVNQRGLTNSTSMNPASLQRQAGAGVNLGTLGGTPGMQRGLGPGLQGSVNLSGLSNQRAGLGNIGMGPLGAGLGSGLGNALQLQNSPGRNSGLGLHPGVGLSSAAYPPSGDLIAMMNKANVSTTNSQLLNATQNAFSNAPGQSQQQNQQQHLQQQAQQQQQQQQTQQQNQQPQQQHGQQPSSSGQDEDQPVFDQSEFPALGGGALGQRTQAQALANGDSLGHGAYLYNNIALQGKAVNHFAADFSIQNESEFPALGSVGSRGGDEQGSDSQGQPGLKVGFLRWVPAQTKWFADNSA